MLWVSGKENKAELPDGKAGNRAKHGTATTAQCRPEPADGIEERDQLLRLAVIVQLQSLSGTASRTGTPEGMQ